MTSRLPLDDLRVLDLTVARDRTIGILIGNVVVYLVFTRVWPVSVAARVDTALAALRQQWERLAAEPDLIPQAVQEVLRFEPITPFTARICTDEIEYRGVQFPAGTIVAVCAERGNREDGGEEFDVAAERDSRLLTFGAGAHFCLGINLARAELEEALTFLAPRMRGLAMDGDPELGGVEGIYGVDALPLRWSQ